MVTGVSETDGKQIVEGRKKEIKRKMAERGEERTQAGEKQNFAARMKTCQVC